jgi:hypothetical protein
MHGFSNAGYFLTLGFLSLIGSMAFWFRDVISEGIVFCFTLVVMTVACLFTNQFENIGDNIYLLIPAVTYKNADVQKAQILLENKNKSGVYIWVNLINGKKYVGSSKDIIARLYQYYNVNYLVNYNMYIYKALLKYGYSNFSLDILEYCDESVLRDREQYYIDLIKPRYNIFPTVGSKFNYVFTEEEKIRMSKSQPSCIKLEVLDLETNITTVYNSIGAAAKALGILHRRISEYFSRNQKKPFKGRYKLM